LFDDRHLHKISQIMRDSCKFCCTRVLSDLPYGGFKDRKYGYEGGIEGFETYLHKKLVSLT
jgi:acyl-CoA reductase-like NAD-dependent aldehyde dehydrogenase